MDIIDPYLEDKEWDMEAMVLATIAGQLEDEEEEEEEETHDECGECDEEDPIRGWALGYRGAVHCGESPCEDVAHPSSAAHLSTPPGAVLALARAAADVKSDGSRLPTSGTAQERKEAHFQMANVYGHAAFACGCHIARALVVRYAI